MPPKRTKSGAGSAGVQRWEQALLSANFNEEEKWRGSVSFVLGNLLEDNKNIEIAAAAVASGCRKLFSVITREELLNTVRELGNPKAKKVKETPANYEICEPCKNYLDNGEDIPLPLLAKLIKFRLLDIKTKDVKRRETEKKGPEKEKAGKGGKGDKGKDRSKSPSKGKGGKKTPEPPSPKGDSKLRKRGEEDEDGKYINDEPDDGPHHYVIITGFNHPHIFSHLADIGIIVDSIVKFTSEDYSRYEVVVDPAEETEKPEKDEKQIALEEEVRQSANKEKKLLKIFWKDSLTLLRAAAQGSALHDIARLEYIVKSELIPNDVEDLDKKNEFGVAMFEDVACMIYDLLDAKRQWKTYLDNLKLTSIPTHSVAPDQTKSQETQSMPSMTPAATKGGKDAKEAPALDAVSQVESESKSKSGPDVDMRFYNEIMNVVPQESVSVELMMHCMLEQIVATDEEKEPPSETPRPPRSDGIDEAIASHMSTIAFKLALSDEEQKLLEEEFERPRRSDPVPKQPLLINYNDDITRRLNHLKAHDGFDPHTAELQMMGYLPVTRLAQYKKPSLKVVKDRAARLQELLHYCATGGLTQSEIDHAMKQFVFECVELRETDDDGVFADSANKSKQNNIPWDDPYPFFVGLIPQEIEDDEEDEKSTDAESVRSPSAELRSEYEATPPPESVLSGRIEEGEISRSATSKSSSRRPRSKKSSKSSAKGKNVPSKEATPPPPTPPPENNSRPTSPGILKNSRVGSAQSRKSMSNHSVHWEKNMEGQLEPQPGDDEERHENMAPEPMHEINAPEDAMDTVNDVQKRILDQWCFAEHMEPQVLQQTMIKAMYTHPCVDTYYHKRDHSLLVVLHNPHKPQLLENQITWHTELHSNVGFRNYLEHVACDQQVQEWVREIEAKYQASLLAQEVEQISKEADEAASRPASGKDKKRDRSKSPKKSSSRAGKSPSRSSSAERPPSSNPYARQGSLKAWKEEQDKVRAEEEEREKQKQEKRARSASKKASKEQLEKEEKEKEKKRPGSRNSSKSRQSKEEVAAVSQDQSDEAKQPERYWPFTGYDMGNDLLHSHGSIKTMFSADGGIIRTEQTQFIQGSNTVKSSVVKDGHVFTVHVLDPKLEDDDDDEEEEIKECEKMEENRGTPSPVPRAEGDAEKSDHGGSQCDLNREATPPVVEAPPKPAVGCFGSFSAQLVSGMSLSFSTYGYEGEPINGKKYEPAPYNPPAPRSPSPASKESPAKGKKGKGDKDKAAVTPEPSTVEEPVEEPAVEERNYPEQPFQSLFATTPDGLCVNYFLESAVGIAPEDNDDRRLLVRQSYPYKTRGVQKCEASRKMAMEEHSRVVNSDGSVVKTMSDGSLEILHADGSVNVFCQNSPLIPASRSASKDRAASARSERESPSRKTRKQKSAKKISDTASEAQAEEDVEPGFWITTLSSGERICTKLDHSKLPVKGAQICIASDPQTGQTMHTREDHVITVYHPDGTVVVEHSDGTRITTFYREVEIVTSDPNAGETGEAPDMDTKKTKFVCVECPGFATVKFDSQTRECRTEFGDSSVIHAMVNGSYDLYASDGSYLQVDEEGGAVYFPRPNNDVEMMNPNQQLQYVMRHFADVIVETVDNAGNIFNVKNSGETCVTLPNGEDMMAEEIGEGTTNNIHTKEQVLQYKQHAPRFFILHDDASGTELLRYQDVAEYIANAEDDAGTAILMDPLPDYPGVVGITVLKPYARDISSKWYKSYEQESIIPPGLTSRDLKTLPPSEGMQDTESKFGANVGQGLSVGSVMKNAIKANILKCPNVLELRQILQYKPVTEDLRTKLGSGLRQYAEFVKERMFGSDALQVEDPRSEEEKILAADLQALATSDSGRNANLDGGDVKGLYEKATAPPVPSPPPTPQPKRTKADWERDERERAEEVESKKALREHDVPPYFESELGKAFLLTQAPDMEALTRQLAEDRRHPSERAVRSPTPPAYDQTRHQVPISGSSQAPTTTTMSPPTHGNLDNSPSPLTGVNGDTPSALRPGNPTPGHATGQGSPAPLRPGNPTPSQANKTVPDRPGAPTPKEASNNMANSDSPSSHAHPSIPEQPQEELYDERIPTDSSEIVMTRSLAVNVVGEPRQEPVRVPAYIKGTRPGAQPNQRFADVEEPVRRKVFTSSVVGSSPQGSAILRRMRGLEVLPERCDFGVLREGSTYSITVHLKNSGVDSCRFRVKQPPPSTGIKVIYQPGPVAAGMKAELKLEIYAIAVGVQGGRGVGLISHNLEVVTETDQLFIPVTASVLTAHDYDNRGAESPKGNKGVGVKLITSKPPGGQGIIRPRRDEGVAH